MQSSLGLGSVDENLAGVAGREGNPSDSMLPSDEEVLN